PMFVTPVLPTTDGPSHLYNALIGHSLSIGRSLYEPVFEVAGGFRPNVASWTILQLLGPLVGWPVAERVLASLAAIAVFGAVLFLWRRFGQPEYPLLHCAAGAWFASSWFLWMGFYDFSLSLAPLFLLPVALRIDSDVGREVLVGTLMAVLFATHLFSFAVGVGLCLFAPTWRTGELRGRLRRLTVRSPFAFLLAHQLFVAPSLETGSSLVAKFDPLSSFVGVVLGDYLVTFSALDLLGSVVVTVIVLAWLLSVGRRWLEGALDLRSEDPHVVMGVCLVIGSIFVPDLVAEGEFVQPRMRAIGTVFLFGVATRAEIFRDVAGARVSTAATTVLLVGFAVHTATVWRAGGVVSDDLDRLERIMESHGAEEGDWTQNPLIEWKEDGFFRIDPYAHLDDRLNLERGFLAAENYEAFRGVFPIRYRVEPNRLAPIDWPDERDVALEEAGAPWPETLYVIHPPGFAPTPVDPRIRWGPSRAGKRVAVTRVDLRIRRRATPPTGPERSGE
ncbi:MAG: hypothetical protein R3324_07055, partial [Halobacteriales archaeon]|nr:hypothetical protein [Halobacteriales archaeon]